jgi:putative ABC transport system ATP-binding protein
MADAPPTTATRLLLRGLARHRARVLGFCALLSAWQLCEALVPVLIGVVIDRAVATSDTTALLWWGGALVLLFGCLSYAYRFGSRLGFGVMQREMHLLRMEVSAHALDARGTRTGLLPGETLSLATSDVEHVGHTVRATGYTVSAAFALLVSAWVLLRTDVVLGLVVLVGVPLVLAVIQVVAPAISRRSSDQQASIARAAGVATDLVRGLRTIKGIGAEDVAADRYRRQSQHARHASVRTADSHGSMLGLTTALSGLFLALVALLAGRLALEGSISVGELVAVVGLTQFLAEPIGALGEVSAQVARSHASARRIVDFLATSPLVPAGDRVADATAPTVALRSVRSGPLVDLTLTSRPGELLGIAVEDPAAAARLVGLLAGEVLPDVGEGVVNLDGTPLQDLTVPSRRACLLVAPHHVDLVDGTLRSNIDPDGSHDDERLDAILSASSAADVVRLHEDGLDQAVTPDGATYSGGQRQRVSLARALAADVPVLVLHDPTTAVDAVTEHRIARGVREARHAAGSTRTTWLVTCSPALLARTDRVVLVRDGRVVAEGTHHDLAADAAYRELVLR